jgi:hypothetical protein
MERYGSFWTVILLIEVCGASASSIPHRWQLTSGLFAAILRPKSSVQECVP